GSRIEEQTVEHGSRLRAPRGQALLGQIEHLSDEVEQSLPLKHLGCLRRCVCNVGLELAEIRRIPEDSASPPLAGRPYLQFGLRLLQLLTVFRFLLAGFLAQDLEYGTCIRNRTAVAEHFLEQLV